MEIVDPTLVCSLNHSLFFREQMRGSAVSKNVDELASCNKAGSWIQLDLFSGKSFRDKASQTEQSGRRETHHMDACIFWQTMSYFPSPVKYAAGLLGKYKSLIPLVFAGSGYGTGHLVFPQT